jgi:hypothetical protein
MEGLQLDADTSYVCRIKHDTTLHGTEWHRIPNVKTLDLNACTIIICNCVHRILTKPDSNLYIISESSIT